MSTSHSTTYSLGNVGFALDRVARGSTREPFIPEQIYPYVAVDGLFTVADAITMVAAWNDLHDDSPRTFMMLQHEFCALGDSLKALSRVQPPNSGVGTWMFLRRQTFKKRFLALQPMIGGIIRLAYRDNVDALLEEPRDRA